MKKITTIFIVLSLSLFIVNASEKKDFKQLQKCRDGYQDTMKLYRHYMLETQSSSCKIRKKDLVTVMITMSNNLEKCYNIETSHLKNNADKVRTKYKKYHSDLENLQMEGMKECGWTWMDFENI